MRQVEKLGAGGGRRPRGGRRAAGRRRALALVAGAALAACGGGPGPAGGGPGGALTIGVLSDMAGPYADLAGKGSVVAAEMAVEDFGGQVGGRPVRVVSADHQNKPDVGSSVARTWFDVDGVDVIVDVPTSSVALAVSELARGKNKAFLASGPGTADLTGKSCSPNTVHWTYDTWALANGTGKEVVKAGGDKWFFLTADYAFGHALERDVSAVVKASGGEVLGGVRHPLNGADFSSFLLQARASKATIVGLANAGADTVTAIKQAAEFGLARGGQRLAGLLVFISDIDALGLSAARDLMLTSAFYWDRDEATRGFAKRFAARRGGRMPTMVQAGVYASVLHYLKAAAALQGASADGRAVVEKMKALPTDDPAFGRGSVREDGRKIHPMYLYQVKRPDESKGRWDYYKLVREIPAAEAFRPPSRDCPLVKP
ncbi:MAG TPA: ABC transporter substrate-binding protein [Polyangiaceae bacterium]|nr:ABC transporter substrate-binding protein [Polyangiaceae bacterium]